MSEKIIDIKGMHCKSCVKLIETKLSQLKGIEKVKVSFVDEKAFIQFNSEQITLDTIKEEIVDLGYDVDGNRKKQKNTSLLQGIFYGLVPHTGCIAFIIATVLGVTVATELFKPLLMNPYFFYILIAISFVFATISSLFYLKKQGFITFDRGNGFEIIFSRGILKRKWKYLSTMYGTTIFINVFLFFFIFPALANIDSGPPITGSVVAASDSLSFMTLKVAIPCPGHAPLISGELKKISGVQRVKYRFPNLFDVSYDSSTTSKDEILSLDVFNVYKPTIVDGAVSQVDVGPSTDNDDSTDEVVGGGGCGCGRGVGGGCCGCGA